MRNNYTTTLICAIAAAAVLALPAICPAQDTPDEQRAFWGSGERGARWSEPTDEMIDRAMSRLRQNDPEKADQLEQLREKDPEKFKTELREVMREHFRARHREGMEPGKPGEHGERPRFRGRSEGDRPGKGRPRRGRTPPSAHRMQREFLNWLEKDYPEKAEQLAKLKEADPDQYDRTLSLTMKRYQRLFHAIRSNPEMADLLREDFELKQKRDKILRQLRRAKDDAVREDLIAQLQAVLNERFDVIVRRKQMEYEQLLKKLEKLKQQVQKSEAEVNKWKEPDFKSQSIKARVEELLNPPKDFKWD
ncbi:MAG: hypothetical protein ACYST6_16115 [Planctomycetota bacterium]